MNVEDSARAHLEQIGGHERRERGQNHRVCVHAAQTRVGRLSAQGGGLPQGQVVFARVRGYRRWCSLLTAPCRTIGLSDNEGDVISSAVERLQGWQRERRAAEEN